MNWKELITMGVFYFNGQPVTDPMQVAHRMEIASTISSIEYDPSKEIFNLQDQIGEASDGVLYISPIKAISNLPRYEHKDNYIISLYSNNKIEHTNLADKGFETILNVQYQGDYLGTISIITYKNGDNYTEYISISMKNGTEAQRSKRGYHKKGRVSHRSQKNISDIFSEYCDIIRLTKKHEEALGGAH